MNKKFRTVLLMLLFTFTVVVAGKVLADATQGSDNSGKINVNKTAAIDESDGRKANVTLSVSGSEFSTSSTMDVVLVIDRSEGMDDYAAAGDNQIKMAATKAAAIDLANELLSKNTADETLVNMGIVVFGTEVMTEYFSYDFSNWGNQVITSNSLTSDVNTITEMISDIPDSVGGFLDGNFLDSQGTNIQDGLARANSLLAGSIAQNKVVILLTDGEPTCFMHNGEVMGTLGDDSSVCIMLNETDTECTEVRPSDAAKAEADALKDENGINATIYTIGFDLDGNTNATTFLQNVASSSDKAFLSDNAADLIDDFDKIIGSMTVIASDVEVTDIIPAGFTLDETALKNAYGEAVSVVKNNDGTTTIKWEIGELDVDDSPSLTYQVTAKDDYYGGMYTNQSATLTGTATTGNPAYPDGTIEETFPMPIVPIAMKTQNDSYTVNLGDTLTVNTTNGILKNDSSTKLAEGTGTTVTDEIVVKSVSCGNINDITVASDGSFTYTPNSTCYDGTTNKVVFEYEVKSVVTINGTATTVVSNASTITIDLTKDTASVDTPVVTKTNNNGETTKSITDSFSYTIDYTATVEDHIGSTTVTIVDTLPYELDEDKANNLAGGTYNATNKTITWEVPISNINSYENEKNSIHIVKEITVFYKNVPTTVTSIDNSVVVSTNIDNNTAADTQQTTVVGGNVIVEYVDNLGNTLLDSTTKSGLIGTDYKVSANDTITVDGVEYQLVATKVNGKEVAKTNSYSDVYVEADTTVTYVYYKVTGEIGTDQTLFTKEGPTSAITNSGSEFNYTINYQTTINNYIGNATLTVVDTLPYAIDEAKSDLAGGTYDATEKTITWTVPLNNINTYENGAYPVTILKNIKVVYTGLDASERILTNTVSATITTNKSTDTVTATDTTDLAINGSVVAHYVDTNNQTIAEDFTDSGLVGNDYTTSAKTISGYQLVETKGNATGKYIDGTVTVTYVYYKIEGNITEDDTIITKTGTDKATSVTAPFEYTITYNTKITDYIGDATVTIVDTLPYEIDEANSILDGGTYDATSKTITWTVNVEDIDTNANGDKEISITKNIEVVYIGIDPATRTVTNNVAGTVETDLTEKTVTAVPKDTTLEVPATVIAHYVSTTGETLAESVTIPGLVGNSYTTEEKNFTDYQLVEVVGNRTGNYTVEPTEVTYVYYRETGDITNNSVGKIGNEEITEKDEAFKYTINYQTTISNYIGTATVTIVDYLPQSIDVTKSELDGGIYDKDANTITWVINYTDIDTYTAKTSYNIAVTKNIVLVYENVDPTTDNISNKVTVNVKTDITEENAEDEFSTEVNIEGTVKVNYVDDQGNEMITPVTMTGKVGTSYETEEKNFDGYELILVEGNTVGEYIDGEIIVTYTYIKPAKGGDVESRKDTEVLPPKTGVNDNSLIINIISSLFIGLYLLVRKFI